MPGPTMASFFHTFVYIALFFCHGVLAFALLQIRFVWLLLRCVPRSITPAIRDANGILTQDAKGKAEAFSTAMRNKFTLPAAAENQYTPVPVLPIGRCFTNKLLFVFAVNFLGSLASNSATGPDDVPARFLRECAKELAQPLMLLTEIILSSAIWPEIWRTHIIVPLYKKGSMSDPSNYRGVHLTCHIAKIVERLILLVIRPTFVRPHFMGLNQFAYIKGRGARDVLAWFTLVILDGFARGKRFGLYNADVSGAFDRVSKERFLRKLLAKGLPEPYLNLIARWLEARMAHVRVPGATSEEFLLIDMVFQGTVLGPLLWNAYFEDVRLATESADFISITYADDLNCLKEFSSDTSNATILQHTSRCQQQVHEWGHANSVVFEPTKEDLHVIAQRESSGSCFKLLGCIYDANLLMAEQVHTLIEKCRWKAKGLLRARVFHTQGDLVLQYKSKILGYIEYRTSAIYHCNAELLQQLDITLVDFLSCIGLSTVDAFMHHNLLPLDARRDVAILGLLHRTALGLGPIQFRAFFRRLPDSLDLEWRYDEAPYATPPYRHRSPAITNSALGLIRVYNSLSEEMRRCKSVKEFQSLLTEYLRSQVRIGLRHWSRSLSPRWFGQ